MIKLEWDHLILILAVTATHNNLILDLSFLISWAAQSRQPLDIGCWNCHRSFIICFADVHMPFKILCLSVQFTHTKSHHSTTSFYITYLVKQTVNFPFSPFPHLWKSLQFLCVWLCLTIMKSVTFHLFSYLAYCWVLFWEYCICYS